MTTIHDEVLELGAASIDFALTPPETAQVAAHRAHCRTCDRRIVAMRADARALETLPVVPAVGAAASWSAVRGRRRATAPAALRLVAIAALLALLALSALAIGSLRHDRDPRLGVLPPTGDTARATAAPSTTAPPEPLASAPAAGDGFGSGTLVQVAATDLRVRTAPTVDNRKSAKLEPLLQIGSHLKIISGPVHADGYDWYEIQGLDLPHHGWVAAADHDGQAWIVDTTTSPVAVLSAAEQDLVAALRPDVAVHCGARRSNVVVGATAGVDCPMRDGPATRVAAYRFHDPAGAARTYAERLDQYGVTVGAGDCARGTAGDAPWQSVDAAAGRSGCYINANEIANIRVTCGSMYIAILGIDDHIQPLYEWSIASTATNDNSDATPSICRAAG